MFPVLRLVRRLRPFRMMVERLVLLVFAKEFVSFRT
jgi:hypothetical protein